MALIIKGNAPKGKGCDGCEFQTSTCEQLGACTCYMFIDLVPDFHNHRHSKCNIIDEIPDEHGDLVDVQAIEERATQIQREKSIPWKEALLIAFDTADVVVEASNEN